MTTRCKCELPANVVEWPLGSHFTLTTGEARILKTSHDAITEKQGFKMKTAVFWVVAACSLVKFTNVSEAPAASTIRAAALL
jgi:hypothetical protein